MDEMLRAIAEPRRQEILRLVSRRELASGEIAAHFNVSRPAISQHLQVLKSAGLVTERRIGTRHLYQVRPEALAELKAFLDESLWTTLPKRPKPSKGDNRMTVPQASDVEREVRIAASPEIVFSFFTDPVKMKRWKGIDVAIDPRPGGIYRAQITPENLMIGEYVEVVPYGRLVFTWGWSTGPIPPGSTTVEVTLTPDGDGTLLRLRHSGLAGEALLMHAEGWDHYLPRLTAVAEGRDPGPDAHAEGRPMGNLADKPRHS
jgi:uncharacterized protein YndB with AHSA1/START domain/DNA-binding transcriptional ArsR family regulator